MRKLLPLSPLKTDGWLIQKAICDLLVRCSKNARKRPSPNSMQIAPAAISIIAALEKYADGSYTLDQTLKELNEEFW